jgi:hypothetical protein
MAWDGSVGKGRGGAATEFRVFYQETIADTIDVDGKESPSNRAVIWLEIFSKPSLEEFARAFAREGERKGVSLEPIGQSVRLGGQPSAVITAAQ